jgi:hypothetical protein
MLLELWPGLLESRYKKLVVMVTVMVELLLNYLDQKVCSVIAQMEWAVELCCLA